MKTIKYVFTLFMMAALLFGCQEDPKDNPVLQEAFKIHKESMAIHDQVMPQMKDIKDTKAELEQAINGMQIRAEAMDTVQFAALQVASEKLDAADASMREWMASLSEVPGFAHDHNHGGHDHGDHDHGDHDHGEHDGHDHGEEHDHAEEGDGHEHNHDHGAAPKLTPEQILEVQNVHKADILKIKEEMEAALTGAKQLLSAIVPAEVNVE